MWKPNWNVVTLALILCRGLDWDGNIVEQLILEVFSCVSDLLGLSYFTLVHLHRLSTTAVIVKGRHGDITIPAKRGQSWAHDMHVDRVQTLWIRTLSGIWCWRNTLHFIALV